MDFVCTKGEVSEVADPSWDPMPGQGIPEPPMIRVWGAPDPETTLAGVRAGAWNMSGAPAWLDWGASTRAYQKLLTILAKDVLSNLWIQFMSGLASKGVTAMATWMIQNRLESAAWTIESNTVDPTMGPLANRLKGQATVYENLFHHVLEPGESEIVVLATRNAAAQVLVLLYSLLYLRCPPPDPWHAL